MKTCGTQPVDGIVDKFLGCCMCNTGIDGISAKKYAILCVLMHASVDTTPCSMCDFMDHEPCSVVDGEPRSLGDHKDSEPMMLAK